MKLIKPIFENRDSYTLLKQEVTQYIKNVKRKVSPEVIPTKGFKPINEYG